MREIIIPENETHWKQLRAKDITSTEISHPVVVNPAAAAPVVQRLYLTSNATSINNLNKGDVFKIAVTAPVVQPIFGATLTLGADTFKYAAVISAGNNPNDVTVTVNTATEVVDGVSHAAGTVITAKLLADPTTPLTFTATTGPALTGSLGFADSSARNLDTTGSLILTQDVIS